MNSREYGTSCIEKAQVHWLLQTYLNLHPLEQKSCSLLCHNAMEEKK